MLHLRSAEIIMCLFMTTSAQILLSIYFMFTSYSFQPLTDIARNLLAIDFQLNVRNDCDGLKQKFQHAEYLTCDSFSTQPILCDDYF